MNMDVSGKRVIVVGLGASGIAASLLLARRGAEVTATDRKGADSLPATELASYGVKLALGGHAGVSFSRADLIVVSPGVPSFAELEEAEKQGIPVIGEVELAVRSLLHPAPIVAVGGTNGKSTVTTLIGEMFRAAGLRVFVGGNLGEPLAKHADERFDVIVLEVSSFQMERVSQFRPRVSLLLNVTDDHLDRYADFAAYAQAKGNSFLRQEESDLAVVPFDDAICIEQAKRGRGRIATFGEHEGATVRIGADAITDARDGSVYRRADMLLQGGHNAMNVAAAILAARDMSVPSAAIRHALSSFGGLAHRMAFVADVGGVRFYDDSKGTNVGAAVTALLGLSEPKVVLIAGGRDKGGSYAPLRDAVAKKGRAVVVIGEAAPRIRDALAGAVPIEAAKDMREAVRTAAKCAAPGDAVLLSPACSSFDMFADYKERGDVFVREVRDFERNHP